MQSVAKLVTRRLAQRMLASTVGQRFLPLAVTLMVLAVNGLVMAQSSPPAPQIRRMHPPWVGYAVMFILLAIVMVVSLMPSRRSHQD